MPNFQVTVGYKAVFTFDIKAVDEETAKEKAVDLMTFRRDRMLSKAREMSLNDDCYAAHGVLNMYETWNMVQS